MFGALQMPPGTSLLLARERRRGSDFRRHRSSPTIAIGADTEHGMLAWHKSMAWKRHVQRLDMCHVTLLSHGHSARCAPGMRCCTSKKPRQDRPSLLGERVCVARHGPDILQWHRWETRVWLHRLAKPSGPSSLVTLLKDSKDDAVQRHGQISQLRDVTKDWDTRSPTGIRSLSLWL